MKTGQEQQGSQSCYWQRLHNSKIPPPSPQQRRRNKQNQGSR
nr:MAG TPA: hypothetical protein [Caudoviricetes sp.]